MQDCKGIHFIVFQAHRQVEVFLFLEEKNKDFPFQLNNYHKSSDSQRILLKIKIKDKVYSFVNAYASYKVLDRIFFFTTTKSWVKKFALDENNMFENFCRCWDLICLFSINGFQCYPIFFPYRNLLHVSLKMNIGSIKEITFETCRTRNMDDDKNRRLTTVLTTVSLL